MRRLAIIGIALLMLMSFSGLAFAEVANSGTNNNMSDRSIGTRSGNNMSDMNDLDGLNNRNDMNMNTNTRNNTNNFDRDNMNMNTTNRGNDGLVRPYATNEGTNWGWLGLIGLIGLAGVFGRNRDEGQV